MAGPVLWSEVGREESGGRRRAASLGAIVHEDSEDGVGTACAVAVVLMEAFQPARHHLHGAADTEVGHRRRAVAWRQDGLVGSSRGWSPSHGA
jgi:hypothetical protein